VPYPLSDEDLRRLLRFCNLSTPVGCRDAALISLVYRVGLTYHELVSLDLSDLHPLRSGAFIIRARCSEGGRDRQVRATAGTAFMLHRWIDQRGGQEGPLFPKTVTRGRFPADYPWAKMTRDTADDLMDRTYEVAARAGILLSGGRRSGYTVPR